MQRNANMLKILKKVRFLQILGVSLQKHGLIVENENNTYTIAKT